jgi:hypothetical protein
VDAQFLVGSMIGGRKERSAGCFEAQQLGVGQEPLLPAEHPLRHAQVQRKLQRSVAETRRSRRGRCSRSTAGPAPEASAPKWAAPRAARGRRTQRRPFRHRGNGTNVAIVRALGLPRAVRDRGNRTTRQSATVRPRAFARARCFHRLWRPAEAPGRGPQAFFIPSLQPVSDPAGPRRQRRHAFSRLGLRRGTSAARASATCAPVYSPAARDGYRGSGSPLAAGRAPRPPRGRIA